VGEALTGGVQAGPLSREISYFGRAHVVIVTEGNTEGGARREPPQGPARSKNQGMYASSKRENRESPPSPTHRSGVGRSGKAKAATPG
jgi:hypothetical protein